MRTKILHACLMTMLLVATAAGVALAQAPEDTGAPDQTARQERIAKLREARNESLAMFHEARKTALEEYRAAHNATRAQFLEDKAAVLAECAEARNETEDANETSQCVRDGLKPLIEAARAEHKEQREALLAALLEAREEAKAHFREARESFGPRAG